MAREPDGIVSKHDHQILLSVTGQGTTWRWLASIGANRTALAATRDRGAALASFSAQGSRAQKRAVVLIDPPYMPNAAAWSEWGLSNDQLLLIRPRRTADALWSAEQVLRNGSSGALLFWQPQVRDEALCRLQLAAQGSDTMCWLLRPLVAAQNLSPSPLRLALKPVAGGISVHIVKRRGPQHEQPFTIVLDEERARVASEPTSVRAPVPAPAKLQAAASNVAALHSA
jgi:protein ImuA